MKPEAREKLNELRVVYATWLNNKKVGSITTNFFKGNICSVHVSETIKLSVRNRLDQVITLMTWRLQKNQMGSFIVAFIKNGMSSIQTKEELILRGRKNCPCSTEENNVNNNSKEEMETSK